jgi:hypothetical protein
MTDPGDQGLIDHKLAEAQREERAEQDEQLRNEFESTERIAAVLADGDDDRSAE